MWKHMLNLDLFRFQSGEEMLTPNYLNMTFEQIMVKIFADPYNNTKMLREYVFTYGTDEMIKCRLFFHNVTTGIDLVNNIVKDYEFAKQENR